MRLPLALAVDGEKPKFLQRDAECLRHIFLAFPNGQIVTFELRLVREQIPQIAVACPHRSAEESVGLRDRHNSLLFCESQLARG